MPKNDRIGQSSILIGAASWLLAAYLRRAFERTRWQWVGVDELKADLSEGPVTFIGWHSNVLIAPLALVSIASPVVTLRDPSPAGALSAATQMRLGLEPVRMPARSTTVSAARAVLMAAKAGKSLGLTADGPRGPAGKVKNAPIDWAAAIGRPVWLLAWDSPGARRLPTWDKMKFPRADRAGAIVFSRFTRRPPRRLTDEERKPFRKDLQAALNACERQATKMARHGNHRA